MPPPRSERRLARIRAVLAARQPDLTVVMENIHDPHNVSAIFRTCDAVGVTDVHLVYSTERFPRIGKKSSSSANKWLGRVRHASVDACYRSLRQAGFVIVATSLGPDTVPLYDLDYSHPTAFVLGNEHRGVSSEAAAAADHRIAIPMMGMIQSLNVSVAAAVCLYEAMRQRLRSGKYASPQFRAEDLEAMFRDWVGR
jgi:tRNA (guanosine-2'-O-)-methyltransferase